MISKVFGKFAIRVRDWSGILLLFCKRYSGKPDPLWVTPLLF